MELLLELADPGASASLAWWAAVVVGCDDLEASERLPGLKPAKEIFYERGQVGQFANI